MARRSVLFSPGDRPEMLRKAPSTGADVVVFDLEDAVAPDRKDQARETVQEVLTDPEFDPECEVCVRVNRIGVAADGDLAAVAPGRPDAIVLPKAESGEDVETLAALMAERDLEGPILALVETPAGVLHAEAIAAAGSTDALIFGAEDLAAAIGADRTVEGDEVLYAREHVVLAAAAAGVDAIDTVYTDTGDVDGLREEATFASGLGFDGKLAIHPAQVAPINESFAPARSTVEWARRVVEASEEHDGGVFSVDGEMIDAPLIRRAERVLERSAAPDEPE